NTGTASDGVAGVSDSVAAGAKEDGTGNTARGVKSKDVDGVTAGASDNATARASDAIVSADNGAAADCSGADSLCVVTPHSARCWPLSGVLVAGCWMLVTDCWMLVTGSCILQALPGLCCARAGNCACSPSLGQCWSAGDCKQPKSDR
ncbi:MAG: hypothetical protein EBZ75_13780, partial [Oxalobacteraceae bacterium]|nr:hypothetical protein [Oxalobacteraceae bacterium]